MATKKKAAPQRAYSIQDLINEGIAYTPESTEATAAAEPEKRTWGQAAGDTVVQLAEGVNTTLGAVPSIVSPDGAMAGFFRDNADYWRDKQSEVLKQRIAATDQRIQEAGKEGVMSQIGTAVSEYWNDPAQAARLVATNLPSMVATLGTGALAGATAKGVAAARGLDAANKAALAAQYGTRTAMATNAALNAGGARGEAFEDLKRTALAQGMSQEQAEQAALDGSILPGVVGGVAGAISGKLGLEKALLGQPGAGAGTALRRSAGAFGAELAGEQIEEVAPKITTNYEAGKIDPARSLTDDLGRTMVETTIGAGPGALVAGGVEGLTSPAKEAADTIRATEKVPESGPMTRASNAATEAKAQAVEAGAPLVDEQATAEPMPEPVDDPVRDQILALPDGARQDALRAYAVVNRTDVAKGVQQYNRKLLDRLLTENAPPPVLGESLTGTDMGTMLGGGGMAGNTDPLMGALGMGREAQANSITNVANVAERRPPMPASDAARMLDEARNRGLDLAVAEHPAGGFVLVPPNWVTPDMAAQGETRLAETIARMQQADAAPVERAPRTRTDGVGLNLQTDPVQNYLDNLRGVNTPAARAYVRDFDAGRITPADVQQRMQAEKGKTPDQRIAQAAAEAPAQTDPVADRLARAAAQGMATPAPTDILNPAGLPFKTKMAADLAAKKSPGAAVLPVVDGGFLVRPQEPVNVQDVPQAPEVPKAAPVVSQPSQAQEAVGAQPADPTAGVPTEGAGAVEAAGVSGEFADLFDEQGRPKFPNAQSVKDFKERTGLGQAGVRAIQAAIQEGRPITVDEARQADLAGQERRQAALEQSKAESEAETQAAKQNSAKPTEPSKVLGDYEIPGIEGVTNRVRVLQRGGRIEAIGLDEGTVNNDLSRLIQSGQTVEQALATLYGDHGPNEAPNPSRVKRAGQPTSAAAPAAESAPTTTQQAPEQSQETTHNGTRIYPTKIKVGDEVKSMWAAESPDNQRRRAAGERAIGGDSLHDTLEQAQAAAEREAKRDAAQQAAKAEQDAADKERLDAEEARKAANRPKTLMEHRKDAVLSKQVLDSETGNVMTRREWVENKVSDGLKTSITQEDKIKPMSRRQIFRADNRQQAEHDRKVKEAGKKDVYWLGDFEVTKIEYDYAQELKAQRAAAPQAAESPTLQTAMGDAGWAGETGQGDTIWTKRANGERYTALLSPDAGSMEVTVLVGAVDTQIASFKVGDAKAAAEAANKAVAQDVAEQSPADDALPNGWIKIINGYTKRPVYRMEQGGGQPFAVVTQVEGMQYEVQIRHGDKQLTASKQTGALSEVLAKAEAELTRMTQADSVTHQDPGEKAEAATPGVVTDSLKKAARNEDTKPSEMRKWLVAEIDKELLQAADRPDYDEAVKRMGEKDAISMFTGNGLLGKNNETGFITFDVPGDGKYKVRNSVRGLLEFRKNVMASQGFKDSGQKRVKPEQNDGVQGGSGGSMTAIANMIEEGDFEAARDYAEAVGVSLDDVKVPKGERKTEWEMFRKTGFVPRLPDTRPQPAPKTAAQVDEEKRQAAEAAAPQPDTPKLTPAEAKSLMAWEDLGQKDGVKTHALTFYESQADKDAKRGRMIVAKVSKGDRSATAWMVDGEDKTFGMLAQAKKLAEEVGMVKAVADGFVEQGAKAPKSTEKPAAPATTSAPIQDAGEIIGGARKDRWKERGLNLDDLDAMTEAEGAELATKANVWKPDYEAMSEASEPVTSAMVKTIYDQLAAKPKKNTPEGRRQYVQMMRIVRDVLTEADGPEAVKNAYQEIRKRAGLNTLDPKVKADGRELLFSVYKGRSDPFVFGFNELQRAKKLVEDGFPAKAAPWKSRLSVGRREGGNGTTERGIEMYMELSAEVGTPLTREQIEAGFFRVVDKKSKAVAFAATKEDAEAAAKTVYERDMKGKKDGKPEPVRPNLDELKRENLPKRIERDVKADDFVNDLGFRGIEFGNWSAQDERQRILNMAYDGLMDLAEIMGVPPKAMSLNGTLGMAFGARGGGRFAAHYEPGKLVINMTKIRGGGSMAHEWAHAMDHYFGELDKPDAYTTQARGASGWYSEDQYLGVPRKRMERVGNEWKNVEKMRLDNLRPEMAAAFDEVMRALFSKQITKAEMVRSHELDLERTEALARNETQADLKAMYQNMAQNKRQALNELRGDPEGTMYAGRGRSDYASQAQALSGKSENGYWTRPTEMFARAFESWVFDRVTAMGARSDYLVHGVEEDRFAGGAYKGNPYPAGEERARINAAFDKLAQTIKTKETDKGVAMFSRVPAGFSPEEAVAMFNQATPPNPYPHKLQATLAAAKHGANAVQADNGGWLLAPKAQAYTAQELQDAQQRIDKLNRALKKHNNVTPAAVLSDAPTPAMAWGRSIARTLGYNVTFIQPNPDFHGVAVGGDAFVSASADHPEIGLIGHEVLHSFKQSSPDIYQALAERIRPYLKDGVVDAKRRWEDANGGRDTSMAHAEEEVLADLNGAMWLDPKFWREMAKNDPSLFRQVAYKFMEVATKAMKGLSRFKADALVTDVDAVRKIIAQEWATQAQEMGNPSEFSETDGPAFSRTAGDQTQTEAFKRWYGDWQNTSDVPKQMEPNRDGAQASRNGGAAPIDGIQRQAGVDQDAARADGARRFTFSGASGPTGADGAPVRLYHGTKDDIAAFDLAHPRRKDKGWLGNGVYLTSNLEDANQYARAKRGDAGPNLMPLYANVRNPYEATMAEKARLKGASPKEITAFTDGLKAKGHDGVVLWDDSGHMELVAFNAADVKSAIGNNGDFDPANADIRFSRTTDAAKAVGDTLKSITVANIKQRAGFKLKDYLGLGLQALGRRQIVDIYGDLLPLTEYNRLVQQMEADKNEGGSEADQLVTRWAKLDDESKLADLMHDATLAQIDPDKPFADGDDKGKFLMLERKFKLLSDEAKAVYRDTRDAYKAHHAQVRSAIKERIERSEIKGERKAALLKQMDDEFFAAVKGVYFPLARFGQYAVTVKGPDGKVESVSRAEGKAEAEALRNNLLSAFPRDKGFTVGRVMLSKEFVASRDAVGRGFMTELYQVLDKQDMDAVQRAELEDTLGQLYLSSLPDLSWAKHGIHRKGTPGFSQDARRAFAQNMFHGARYLAKLRYSDLMQDELAAMQKHVDDWREVEDFDQNSAQRVVTEMYHRHESLMNPKSNKLSTWATSLGFVFHLGLSPASAMVNLSQTALVAYPIMGAKWGFGKASAALLKASAEAAKGKNDITASLNEDERAAYDEAVRAGTIDVTMAHDLAGIAQGEDAGVMWKIRPVMRYASFLFHHAERFNRQVTFVAAYRLAREAGADQKAAFEQATKATYDGHFDYSAANKARIMQGNVAKVLLLFKQYGQNMVYTLARNAQQAMKAETPEARTQARKALGGLLAMHAAAAGVLGLPMVTTLLAAASMIGGDDDEPWDAKVALQNMLADTFGQKPAEVLAHGLSRLTPWDISGRVGLDRLIFPDVQEGLEGQRLWESAATQALGPVGGIFGGLLKGADLISDGHYKLGLEAMLPAVLRQGVKSIRYATDGAQDKTGVVIKDEVSLAGVAGQLLGFSPSEVRLAQEGKSAIYQHDKALGERRQELLTKAARATMAKDAEARAEAMKEIQRFNQKNPTRRITPLNVLQSVRNSQRRIDQAEGGVYLPKNRRDAIQAGRFALAESE